MVNTQHRKLGKRVTVESGSTQTQVSAQRGLLSKKPAEITDGQMVQESVVLSNGGPQGEFAPYSPTQFAQGNSGQVTFRDLDPTERQDAKRIMKDLDQRARLFARDDQEQLVRVSAATAKQLLDQGQEVEVVTRLGSESRSSGSSRRSDWHQEHIFIPSDHAHSSSSTSSKTVKVEYSSSPINDWDSVLWHGDEDVQGVPGTPQLPASGSPVTISHEWENKWKTNSADHSGFFRVRSKVRSDSGYQTVREVAEG